MADRYWVGGTGTWDDTATTHWSTSNGGSSGASAPTASDNVFLNGNSGGGVITLGTNAKCLNLDSTSCASTFSTTLAGGSVSCFGNIVMGVDASNIEINWASISGTSSITSNGFNLGGLLIGSAQNSGTSFSGTYTLNDALNCPRKSSFIIGRLTIVSNISQSTTFNTNNFSVTVAVVAITKNGTATTINMGTGLWTISGLVDQGGGSTPWSAGANVTLNPSTSTIKFTDTTNLDLTFAGGGYIYNNIFFSRGTITASIIITGSNTFADFKDNGTGTHSILFTTGTTQTFTTWHVSGTSGHLITINSTTTGAHNLSCISGIISSDFLNIQHSVAGGGAGFFAGSNSTNNQVTATVGSGWAFTAAPNIISPFPSYYEV